MGSFLWLGAGRVRVACGMVGPAGGFGAGRRADSARAGWCGGSGRRADSARAGWCGAGRRIITLAPNTGMA